jgi:hypothetical protein
LADITTIRTGAATTDGSVGIVTTPGIQSIATTAHGMALASDMVIAGEAMYTSTITTVGIMAATVVVMVAVVMVAVVMARMSTTTTMPIARPL